MAAPRKKTLNNPGDYLEMLEAANGPTVDDIRRGRANHDRRCPICDHPAGEEGCPTHGVEHADRGEWFRR